MKPNSFSTIVGLVLLFFVSSFTAEAQHKIKAAAKAPDPKVIADKSGVYVTYERRGQRTPLRADERGGGIWLRFNNNMRYSISVCAFGIPENPDQPTVSNRKMQLS